MENKLYKLMNWPRIEGIIYSEEDNPHEILGAHISGKNVLFQTFWPGACSINIITGDDGKKHKMEMVDEVGYFAALMPGTALLLKMLTIIMWGWMKKILKNLMRGYTIPYMKSWGRII